MKSIKGGIEEIRNDCKKATEDWFKIDVQK